MIAGAARAGGDSNPNHLGPITWTLAFTLGVLAVILSGCSSQNFTPARPPAPTYYTPSAQSYGTSRSEVASWYGPGFAGRRTSTGETYNPEGLTAASKTLPLGSHVRVTNPDTGRSVVVRINDRGPFVRGRSLDLSHGAAQQIGLTGKGVGRVRVTPTATSTPALSSATSTYAESSVTPTSRHVSYVSYPRRPTYVAVRHRHYRYHYTSSRRIVSNPIGAWLSSAVPRF
jgi:rare lipoprotein A (peptidoglycan hydrolase)